MNGLSSYPVGYILDWKCTNPIPIGWLFRNKTAASTFGGKYKDDIWIEKVDNLTYIEYLAKERNL